MNWMVTLLSAEHPEHGRFSMCLLPHGKVSVSGPGGSFELYDSQAAAERATNEYVARLEAAKRAPKSIPVCTGNGPDSCEVRRAS